MRRMNLRFWIFVMAPALAAAWALSAHATTASLQSLPPIVTPGEASAPPSDAIVLFGGSSLDEFRSGGGPANWPVVDGVLTVGKGDLTTKREFGDIQLHLEWRVPSGSTAAEGSQDRGNSGIKLHEAYEIQILDSYRATSGSAKGQAGSVYAQTPPLVNACRPPGEWQTYDIVFRAPYFDDSGELVAHGRVTVIHNGVLVQDHTKILGRTNSRVPARTPYRQPFFLQEHGSKVQYRSIWVRELERRELGEE